MFVGAASVKIDKFLTRRKLVMDSLASAVISSKVKGITKDFGDVVGLNENDDQESSVSINGDMTKSCYFFFL